MVVSLKVIESEGTPSMGVSGILIELLESVSLATTLADVNIAAGIALEAARLIIT